MIAFISKEKRDVYKTGTFGLRKEFFYLKGKRDVLLKTLFCLFILIFNTNIQSQTLDTVVAVVEPPTAKENKVYYDKISKNYVPAITKRKVRNDKLTQLQQDEAFWYANKDLKKKEPAKKSSPNFLFELLQEKWFKTLLWFVIVGSFVAIIVWYLSSINIRLFRKASTAIAVQDENRMPEDIFSIPYESKIREAIQQNQFRLAVRLLYLQTLMRLAHKNLIQFKQDKTNSQYLAQLYNTAYYKDFFSLTRHFEYTWYGQFPLSETVFRQLQKDFETFNRELA